MRTLRKAGRALNRLLAAIGLITVLVISTPIVSWWVQAYSGPMSSPKETFLSCSAPRPTKSMAASPTRLTGARARRFLHGKREASGRS
jgi:hypothetical protein